jgi:hypothetical protein
MTAPDADADKYILESRLTRLTGKIARFKSRKERKKERKFKVPWRGKPALRCYVCTVLYFVLSYDDTILYYTH